MWLFPSKSYLSFVQVQDKPRLMLVQVVHQALKMLWGSLGAVYRRCRGRRRLCGVCRSVVCASRLVASRATPLFLLKLFDVMDNSRYPGVGLGLGLRRFSFLDL
jgi:hypothetical protein